MTWFDKGLARLQRTAHGNGSSSSSTGAFVSLCLHSASSFAHLEDLKDRMFGDLGAEPHATRGKEQELVETLGDVARRLDRGAPTTGNVLEAFAQLRVPEFDLGRWLAEMLDEGVYLEVVFERAA